MPYKTRLLVIEDSVTFIHGLRAILDEAGGFDIVAVTDNKEEGLALARRYRPDIALVDLQIRPRPGALVQSADEKHGLELIELLRVHVPDSSIVTITFHREKHLLRQAIQSGTMAYISKDWEPEKIVFCLQLVANGQVGLTREQLALLSPQDRKAPFALTSREMDVLRLLEQGLSNRDIARQLNVRVSTIRKHVERIREKLNVKTRGEAVARARKKGFI